MAISLEELEALYNSSKYREVITAYIQWRTEIEAENPDAPVNNYDLRAAWAYYQLGELDQAESLATLVATRFPAMVDGLLGRGEESMSRLLLAHCAERRGNLDRAENLLKELPSLPLRDNLWLAVLIARQRNGEGIDASRVMELATAAMRRVPYQTVDGHITNNAAWLLYGAREQEGVKPFLPILPGLIEVAIGVYEATNAAQNHRATALFRASQIFEAADWLQGALLVIRESIAKWEELVKSQGGERYQQNLQGAERQLRKLALIIMAQ